jgi:hypothetical protein
MLGRYHRQCIESEADSYHHRRHGPAAIGNYIVILVHGHAPYLQLYTGINLDQPVARIIANVSKVRQIRTIIDGMSRDIDGRRDIGYPVYDMTRK